VMVQGQGSAFQGVFVRTTAAHPFQNVTISGNLLVGGLWNGVYVEQASNVQVTNNTLTAVAGSTYTPMLRVLSDKGVQLSGNTAPKFDVQSTATGVTQSSEVTKAVAVTDHGLATINSWLSSHAHSVGIGPTTASALIHGVGAGGSSGSPVTPVSTPVT